MLEHYKNLCVYFILYIQENSKNDFFLQDYKSRLGIIQIAKDAEPYLEFLTLDNTAFYQKEALKILLDYCILDVKDNTHVSIINALQPILIAREEDFHPNELDFYFVFLHAKRLLKPALFEYVLENITDDFQTNLDNLALAFFEAYRDNEIKNDDKKIVEDLILGIKTNKRFFPNEYFLLEDVEEPAGYKTHKNIFLTDRLGYLHYFFMAEASQFLERLNIIYQQYENAQNLLNAAHYLFSKLSHSADRSTLYEYLQEPASHRNPLDLNFTNIKLILGIVTIALTVAALAVAALFFFSIVTLPIASPLILAGGCAFLALITGSLSAYFLRRGVVEKRAFEKAEEDCAAILQEKPR